MALNKKMGIFGGTFNPIHYGHLLIAENACAQFDLDHVIFLPTGHAPHKQFMGEDMSVHRCRMVEAAIADNPKFSISYREIQNSGVNYTYATLQQLHQEHPECELYFILGADSLFAIEQWKYFREIFPTCTILAAMRDDKDRKDMEDQIRYLEETYQAKIELLQAPLLEISSTTIRNRAGKGYTVRYMVPDTVAQYIREKGFYKRGKSENTGMSEKETE